MKLQNNSGTSNIMVVSMSGHCVAYLINVKLCILCTLIKFQINYSIVPEC